MRLLVLCAHPEMSPATRFRACAYFEAFGEAGIEVDYQPFLTSVERKRLHGALTPVQVRDLSLALLRRLALSARAKRYDAVFVQREAMLVGPPLMERLLVSLGIPLVYDLDDAVWLHSEPIAGSFRARYPRIGDFIRAPAKGNELIRLASEVTAGSERLAAHAKSMNPNVTVIPTVTDLRTWKPKAGRVAGAFAHDVPIIGWIGTPSTAPSLKIVDAVLGRLRQEGHAFRVVTRGVGTGYTFEHVLAENLPWREKEEPDDFADIDIGLAPMRQDEWSNGKCAFKQIQYLTVGVPCVTSRAGAVDEFIVHDENALVAETEDAFYTHIKALLESQELRTRLVRAGRKVIEDKYCLAAQAPRFIEVIRRAAAKSHATGEKRASA